MSDEELRLCRQAVELLQAEREGVERLLVRLARLCAPLEPSPLRRGVVEAAVEMADAQVGFFVGLVAPDELTDVVGELAVLPRPGHFAAAGRRPLRRPGAAHRRRRPVGT